MYTKPIKIEGVFFTSAQMGAAPQNAINIPVMPMDGTCVITGSITATNRAMVTFFPQFCIFTSDGSATIVSYTSPPGPATQPPDGGVGQGFQPSGPTLIVNGRQPEIALAGAEGTDVDWSFDLTASYLIMD
jgi:hypothetical protein